MQTFRERALHPSALNPAEYQVYMSALTDITELDAQEFDDEYIFQRTKVKIREMKMWIRGRYPEIPVRSFDEVVFSFGIRNIHQGNLSVGQFLAVIRVLFNYESHGYLTEDMTFIQSNPRGSTKPLNSKLKEEEQPQPLSTAPARPVAPATQEENTTRMPVQLDVQLQDDPASPHLVNPFMRDLPRKRVRAPFQTDWTSPSSSTIQQLPNTAKVSSSAYKKATPVVELMNRKERTSTNSVRVEVVRAMEKCVRCMRKKTVCFVKQGSICCTACRKVHTACSLRR